MGLYEFRALVLLFVCAGIGLVIYGIIEKRYDIVGGCGMLVIGLLFVLGAVRREEDCYTPPLLRAPAGPPAGPLVTLEEGDEDLANDL